MSDLSKAVATLEYALENNEFGECEIKAAADLIVFNKEEWESIEGKLTKEFIKKAKAVARKMVSDYKKSVTEMGLAESFLNQHRGHVRYCSDFEFGWMIYDDKQWSEDRTEKIKSKIRDFIKKVASGDGKLEKASVLSSVEKLLKIEQKIRTVAEEWDSDDFLLGIPSGVIDLKTGQQKNTHSEILVSKRSSIVPSKDANCTKWLSFLEDITDGDESYKVYLQKLVGYFLTGSTIEQSIFFGFGAGGNGKSLFVKIIDILLGDYYSAAPFTTFAVQKTDAHPTDLAGFVGKRCVVASETKENRTWNSDLIKSLSGCDKIAARFCHKNFFQYTPNFKLFVIGNHMPNLSSVDFSTRRRFHILPFLFDPEKNKGKINKNLFEELKEELPAIMRWAIDGCILWQKEGLKKPSVVEKMTDSYFESEDILTQFLLDIGRNYEEEELVKSSELFSRYKDYLEKLGEEPSSNKRFSQQLTKLGFKKQRNGDGIYFTWKSVHV